MEGLLNTSRVTAAGQDRLKDGGGKVGGLGGGVVDDAVEEGLSQLGEDSAEIDGLDDVLAGHGHQVRRLQVLDDAEHGELELRAPLLLRRVQRLQGLEEGDGAVGGGLVHLVGLVDVGEHLEEGGIASKFRSIKLGDNNIIC